MLQRVSEIASGPLAEAASRIDREGYYPLDIMARLAEVGAFGAHLDRRGADFGLALAATSEIARSCGSTGFLAWCHNVCGLYMEQSANPALLARLNDHVEGRSFGGTALSNPMKAMAASSRCCCAHSGCQAAIGERFTAWSATSPRQYCGAIAAVERVCWRA